MIFFVSLALFLLQGGCVTKPEPLTVSDCIWSGVGKSWVDINKNGQWDSGENALPGVDFVIDDSLNGYDNVGEKAISDATGQAALSVWLPGCPNVQLVVYVQVPEGYVLTTPTRLDVNWDEHNEVFYFGFVPN